MKKINIWNKFKEIEPSATETIRFVHKAPNRICLPLLFLICFIPWVGSMMINSSVSASLQESISKEIIRFHVIANSDKEEDQALKLKVKNAVVESLKPLLQSSSSIEESRLILMNKLIFIEQIARSTLKEYGYDYSVAVSLTPSYFPMKIYGEYTFPPGIYEALRIEIGRAEGQNWWCVMFPPLCFVDETYSIVDSDTEKQLTQILTEDEIMSLKHQKTPIKYKSKIADLIRKLFN